jgi:hypothetical protein
VGEEEGLLFKIGGYDTEVSKGRDGYEKELALQRQLRAVEDCEWKDGDHKIGRDVEGHLDLAIDRIFGVLDGDRPVLRKGAIEESEIG